MYFYLIEICCVNWDPTKLNIEHKMEMCVLILSELLSLQ